MHTLSRRSIMAALAALPMSATLPGTVRAQDAASSPPALSAYGKLPAIENVAVSPDGKRVALVMDKSGQRVVVDYELATGKAAAIALEGDKLREVMWADNTHVFVVVSNTARGYGEISEQWYGLIFDIPAGKRRQMFSNMGNAASAIVTGDFNRIRVGDGYRITASGFVVPEGLNGADNGSRQRTETLNRGLYAFTPETAKGWKLDEDARPIQNWVIKPDGSIAARSEYDDDTKAWTLRAKGKKGWDTVFAVQAATDMPWLAGLGRDVDKVLVRFNSGEDAGKYYEIDLAGQRTLIELEGPNNSPIFHPATYLLTGFNSGGPLETWTFFDPVMQRLPHLLEQALPDSFNDVLDFAENPRQVVVRSESDGDPGTYFFFDFSSGGVKEIGRAYPDLPPEWVASKIYITYKAADGLDIGAWLTLPPDREAEKLALVVLPHGGPQAMDDIRFDWWSQAIASRGYAVLQPNFRGSDGYGKAFTEKGYGEIGRKMQSDLSDGVAHLVKAGTVDAKRVAIAGGSYGGYAALAGVTLQSGIYRCAVSLAGLSNMEDFLDYRRERGGFDGDSYSMTYWLRFLGGRDHLDEISPVKHVGAVSVPVLLIHGKDDVVVPFAQSQQMYDALKQAGKPVEMAVLDNEDHWLSGEATRLQMVEAMMGFLVRHNPPV